MKGSIDIASGEGGLELVCTKRIPWSSAIVTLLWFALVGLGTAGFLLSYLLQGGFESLSGIVMGVGVTGLGALVFAFGLLHGLGFAEALTALDLPRAEFLGTLVAFNVGVEAGQLTVILGAALALLALRIPMADYRRLVVRPASIAIALMGAYWAIERL